MAEKPFTYEVSEDFDHVLEEHGNTYTAFRKIKWGNSTEFKPDIRKYYATEEGERMAKGCTLSEEGCNELANVLLVEGYGNDKAICETIMEKRPEIMSRIVKAVIVDSEDPEPWYALMEAYPVPDDEEEEEELYDLEEVI